MLMSVEGWARTAGGLLLPTMGFAHKLGRFQPCPPGTCCELFCSGCYVGTLPNQLWVDVPLLANDSCSDCDWYEQTFLLTETSPCFWSVTETDGGPCTLFDGFYIAGNLTAGWGEEGAYCRLRFSATIGIGDGNIDNWTVITWQDFFLNTSPINEIDHMLPYVSRARSDACGAIGTLLHVYE